MHAHRRRPLRLLVAALPTALVGALLALVVAPVAPATAAPVSSSVDLACSEGPSAPTRFTARGTLVGDLPTRVGRGRDLTLSGLQVSLEIPAAALEPYRGGTIGADVNAGVLMQLAGGSGGGQLLLPRGTFNGRVPASGPLTAAVGLGDQSWAPPATGTVTTAGNLALVALQLIGPSGFAFLSCQAPGQSFAALGATEVVEPVTQTVAFTSQAPTNALVGDTYAPSATASSGGAVVLGSDTPAVCTASGGVVTTTAAGACTVRAVQTGDSLTSPASATQTYTVSLRPQTVTYGASPPSPARVGGSYRPAPTASSGLPVTLSTNDPAVCAVDGELVRFVAAGACEVRAFQAGDTTYRRSVTAVQPFTVTRYPQSVAFVTTPPDPARVGATYEVRASASSGYVVTLGSSTPAVCTLGDDGTVTFVAAGTCTLTADRAGTAGLDPAPQATQTFTVTRTPQTVSFTSTPPDPARVGTTYAVTLGGSQPGTATTLTSTTPATCSIAGTTVTLLAAGACTVAADRPASAAYDAVGTTQTFTVTRTPQTVSFTSTPPDPARVGTTYAVTLGGSQPGTASALTSTTPATCTVSGTTVSLVAAGTCTLSASRPASGTYDAAGPVTQTLQVTRTATSVDLTVPGGLVTGQRTTATAVVGGAPSGTVQYLLDGVALGDPVPFTTGASGTSTVTSPAFSLPAGAHAVAATLQPTDPVTYAPATRQVPVTVARAATTTTLVVDPGSLTATVAPVAPGAGTPAGTVRFLVDGTQVGTAPLVGGRAQLSTTTPPGAARDLVATYDGDDFTGSTTGARRLDPTLVAQVTSNRPATPSGWWSARVVVRWACTAPGAVLVTPCPAPVAVVDDGTTTLTRTVTTADGGQATATTVVRLDTTDPRATVRGARKARPGVPGRPRCVATDDTSGVRTCRVMSSRKGDRLVVRAVAYDRAGNKDVSRRTLLR